MGNMPLFRPCGRGGLHYRAGPLQTGGRLMVHVFQHFSISLVALYQRIIQKYRTLISREKLERPYAAYRKQRLMH